MTTSAVAAASVPVASTARLRALSHMVAAAADAGDRERCSTVAHRYLGALLEHLASWGRTTWDTDEGLGWAAQQLMLLTSVRRVIVSTVAGVVDRRAATALLDLTLEYDDMTQREARRRH
jgi:hypothetical protein